MTEAFIRIGLGALGGLGACGLLWIAGIVAKALVHHRYDRGDDV